MGPIEPCPFCETAEHVECVGEGTSWQTNCFRCGTAGPEMTTRSKSVMAWIEGCAELAQRAEGRDGDRADLSVYPVPANPDALLPEFHRKDDDGAD